jgi:hypothetical protein
MTIRRISRGEGLAFLLLCFAGRMIAQQAGSDPGFPKAEGVVMLNDGLGSDVRYVYPNGLDKTPKITVRFGDVGYRYMEYYGYNGDGSWFTGGGDIYTLKGNVLTKHPKSVQLPDNLMNGSAAYLGLVGRQAAPASGRDPNFPNPQDSIVLAANDVVLFPNREPATGILYVYSGGDGTQPSVQIAYGRNGDKRRALSYVGYNKEGSWLGGEGGYYTLRGNLLTKQAAGVQLPKNLRNGSADYRNSIGAGAQESGSGNEGSQPSAANRRSTDTRGRMPISGTVGGPSPVAAAAPGTTAGTDVRIERGSSGTTLYYKDAGGEHSYKVRRPATAGAGVDSVDAGGWVYVAPNGKSGLLLNVSPNHSVTVMPLAQPMLGMLAGRGN